MRRRSRDCRGHVSIARRVPGTLGGRACDDGRRSGNASSRTRAMCRRWSTPLAGYVSSQRHPVRCAAPQPRGGERRAADNTIVDEQQVPAS